MHVYQLSYHLRTRQRTASSEMAPKAVQEPNDFRFRSDVIDDRMFD